MKNSTREIQRRKKIEQTFARLCTERDHYEAEAYRLQELAQRNYHKALIFAVSFFFVCGLVLATELRRKAIPL